VPDGFPMEEAQIQLADFLDVAGDAAKQYGLKVAIEPLNRKESNVINSVAEALELAIAVGRPEVRVLADLYHIDEEQEPLSHVADAGPWMLHTHTADTGRYRPGSGSYDNLGFMRALLNAGYDGRMSVECSWGDFAAEAPLALEFLRETESKARG
jgi:sugar phosphate isomerase/epimerase